MAETMVPEKLGDLWHREKFVQKQNLLCENEVCETVNSIIPMAVSSCHS